MTEHIAVHCSQCDTLRRVAEVMGGNYYVLAICGHVVPIPKED